MMCFFLGVRDGFVRRHVRRVAGADDFRGPNAIVAGVVMLSIGCVGVWAVYGIWNQWWGSPPS